MTHKHMRRYPGVLVGRLAVNQDYSHKGIGSEALLFIKQWFLSPDNKTGCRFVVVDAVNDPDVLKFYQKNGFVFLFTSEEQEFIYTGGKKGERVELDILNFQLICSDNLLRLVFLWRSSFSTYLFRLVSRFTPGWDVKPKSLRNLYLLPDKRCYLGGMPLSLDTSYVPHLV